MHSTFKQRLQQPQAVLAPGVYDALTALIAEQAGFEALYLSGASIAYTRLGRSDIGLTTATEVADTLARITERVNLPVITDADHAHRQAV
jgi:2-methylisocitrate lyase-like PEP mutase family enzyme